jgi:hypothetical protein
MKEEVEDSIEDEDADKSDVEVDEEDFTLDLYVL